MLISDTYRKLNSDLHEAHPEYGIGVMGTRWYGAVAQFAKLCKAETVLDYGCGKGQLARALSHLLVIGYDPAIPGKDETPEPADLVVSLDVLEHIEPDCLDAVLDDMRRCAKRAIFLTVNTLPAFKTLADGRNAHLIQKGAEWWLPKIMERFELMNFSAIMEGEFAVMAIAKPQAAQARAA